MCPEPEDIEFTVWPGRLKGYCAQVFAQIVFCDGRITVKLVSSHNCSSDAQFFHMKHLKMDTCFTWYGDDRYILIGHHAGGAALLHIEVCRLEKSPAEKQSRNVTGKFVTESLSH